MLRHFIIKLLKAKDKENYWNQTEKNDPLAIGVKQFKWHKISYQKHGGQKEVAQCFSKTERGELSAQSSAASENNLGE